jgi:hypothetical protein
VPESLFATGAILRQYGSSAVLSESFMPRLRLSTLKMNATVFYAWQSDRPRKVTRDLIRDAAEAACKRITEDTSYPWGLTLDSDTRGVAGMCDIPNTILEKIKRCDIFLADLTFVGKTEDSEDEQLMPNANVLFELGSAAGSISFESLIGVVNEAFGSTKGQVFDIKRRRSLTYCVSENADPSTVAKERECLGREIEKVLRTTLDTVVMPRVNRTTREHEQEFGDLQASFADRVIRGEFHEFDIFPAALLTIRTSVVNVLEYDDLYRQVCKAGKNARPGEDVMYWNDTGNDHLPAVVELENSGLLRHAYGGIYESFKRAFQSGLMPLARIHPGEPPPRLLPVVPLQVRTVSHLFDQFQLLAKLQLPFPWLVGLSLVGAGGFHLITDSQKSPNEVAKNQVHFGSCTITSLDQVTDKIAVAGCLRDLLNRLCRHVGWERSECFTLEGVPIPHLFANQG